MKQENVYNINKINYNNYKLACLIWGTSLLVTVKQVNKSLLYIFIYLYYYYDNLS